MTQTLRNDYIFSLDPYPQEYDDYNQLAPFYEYLRKGEFRTTSCTECKKVTWPPRTLCPDCWSTAMEWVKMPTEGKVYSYTIQVAATPPGFDPPLVYALVDFDNGIRLFTALIETLPERVKVGSEVEMVVKKVTPDQLGRPRVIPYFKVKS